jgi:hypothetical protein
VSKIWSWLFYGFFVSALLAIRGKRRYVEKNAHPVTFWGIMAFYHVLGGLLVFFALWSLVFGRGVET